ncbi:MAG: pentapeptide repeat-containing protein [Acidimicrobiales bacterium]|jgi:uncharacterized protein YjbI with pentapeptide repeats|nr:pentapeptide repeat-containing protein [Acidimicrobiales bacterium]
MRAAITANCPPGVGQDFSGMDLRGRDLSSESLRCADFSGADLRGATFERADVEYADMERAVVDETTLLLGYVLVSHIPPESSESREFSHTMCQQEEWFLLGSYLDSSQPMACNNVGFNGIDQVIPDNCAADRVRDFSTMDLSGQDLSDLDLSCSDFSYTNLRGADLRGSNLTHSLFWETDLTGADLSGASLAEAGLGLRSTGLQRAHLRGTDLSNTNLEFSLFGSDVTGANLDGAFLSGETRCGDGDYPWPSGAPPEEVRLEDMTCRGTEALGPDAPLPVGYPSRTHAIGNERTTATPVRMSAAWDACPRLITDEDVTPYMLACIQKHTDAGIVYQTYHPLGWVEAGVAGWQGIVEDYPDLRSAGLPVDMWGETGLDETPTENGWITPPRFSNASDAWLDFMIGVIRTQVDAGVTGIAFDEGWGSLGPGPSVDFNVEAMSNFREYLAVRYSTAELSAKGIDDVATFNWLSTVLSTEVHVDHQADPGQYHTPGWWQQLLGRSLAPGETYTRETIEQMLRYPIPSAQPVWRVLYGESSDFEYFNRLRQREVYQRIGDEIRPYAESLGQPWYLAANIYNGLGWDNAAIAAPVLDIPIGELSTRDARWPGRNFTSFIKNMAAIGKRFAPMFYPGQVLTPSDDNDTEATLMFVADLYAAGGVSQYPDSRTDDAVQDLFELIQSDEGFFSETDNRVGLYYSLGNHMGDVGRPGIGVWAYYGAARLLEDSHYSYDVLYQGDPDMGSGTVRWVDQQISPTDLAGYGMVVLPNTIHMTDAEVANLSAWVEAGGVLVVFGAAGTYDFSYPSPVQRDDAAWNTLTTTAGTSRHGSGTVIVFPGDEWSGLANRYDGSLDPADLDTFSAAAGEAFTSSVTTDAGPLVHIHRFADPSSGREILHLVNFDYNLDSDSVISTGSIALTIRTTADFADPVVRYHTPDDPRGTALTAGTAGPTEVSVTLPDLHVYGIVTVEEDGR